MSDVDEGQMPLATLTRLWLFPRYLYRIGDKALSQPVNLRAVGWALLLIPGFWFLSSLQPVDPLTGMGLGLVPRLMVPALLVWAITTKIAQGAKPWEVAWSWTRHAWHHRLRPATQHPITLRSRIRTF